MANGLVDNNLQNLLIDSQASSCVVVTVASEYGNKICVVLVSAGGSVEPYVPVAGKPFVSIGSDEPDVLFGPFMNFELTGLCFLMY